jgi:hypothetical protein
MASIIGVMKSDILIIITVLDGDEDFDEIPRQYCFRSVGLLNIHTSPLENNAKVTIKYFLGSKALSSPIM